VETWSEAGEYHHVWCAALECMAFHPAPHDEQAPPDPDDDDTVDYPDPEDVDLDAAPSMEGDDYAAHEETKGHTT
jgi:hypothetical protein